MGVTLVLPQGQSPSKRKKHTQILDPSNLQTETTSFLSFKLVSQ
jgi:hypothetical protein